MIRNSTSELLGLHCFRARVLTVSVSAFSGSFAVIEEHTNAVLPNCFDAIGLLLMIRLTNEHKVIYFILIY
jgi:hypothetical protein